MALQMRGSTSGMACPSCSTRTKARMAFLAQERARCNCGTGTVPRGTVHDEAALQTLLAAPPPRSFDADVQRILQRWLAAEPLASRELREAQRPG